MGLTLICGRTRSGRAHELVNHLHQPLHGDIDLPIAGPAQASPVAERCKRAPSHHREDLVEVVLDDVAFVFERRVAAHAELQRTH
jgi:hypothetical protein